VYKKYEEVTTSWYNFFKNYSPEKKSFPSNKIFNFEHAGHQHHTTCGGRRRGKKVLVSNV